MKRFAWVAVALSAGLLTGCPDLMTAKNIEAINSALAEYGFSLKTIDEKTGQEKAFTNQDVEGVYAEDGTKIEHSFDANGKLIFRPKKEGEQQVRVKLKDGTVLPLKVEGKKGETRMTGDAAFIPDSSGQGFTTEVRVGGSIDVKARHDAIQSEVASSRAKLLFGAEGLKPATLRAVYVDRQKLPPFSYAATEDGNVMVDLSAFFFVKHYQAQFGKLPPVRVAYQASDKITVVVATLATVPELPEFNPPKPGEPAPPPPRPDQFKAGQEIELENRAVVQANSLAAYEQENSVRDEFAAPGEAPPPPPAANEDPLLKIQQYAPKFEIGLVGVTKDKIRMLVVGKQVRPNFDLVDIDGSGHVKLDPMLLYSIRMEQFRIKQQTGTATMPNLRIFYESNTGIKERKFTLKPVPDNHWLPMWAPFPQPGQPFFPPAMDRLPQNQTVLVTELDIVGVDAPVVGDLKLHIQNTILSSMDANP